MRLGPWWPAAAFHGEGPRRWALPAPTDPWRGPCPPGGPSWPAPPGYPAGAGGGVPPAGPARKTRSGVTVPPSGRSADPMPRADVAGSPTGEQTRVVSPAARVTSATSTTVQIGRPSSRWPAARLDHSRYGPGGGAPVTGAVVSRSRPKAQSAPWHMPTTLEKPTVAPSTAGFITSVGSGSQVTPTHRSRDGDVVEVGTVVDEVDEVDEVVRTDPLVVAAAVVSDASSSPSSPHEASTAPSPRHSTTRMTKRGRGRPGRTEAAMAPPCALGTRSGQGPTSRGSGPMPGEVGAREGNRTLDLLITSELLCRLSYPGGGAHRTRSPPRRGTLIGQPVVS